MSKNNNPLLELKHPIPFDKISSEHVIPAIREILSKVEKDKQVIINLEERNYDNTLLALDRLGSELDFAWRVCQHLESVNHSDELHAAIEEVRPEVTAFFSELLLSEGLWNALLDYSKTEEAKALSGTNKRFLEKLSHQFKRHGTNLPQEKKDRLIEIAKTLSELSSKFRVNILEGIKAFSYVTEDIAELQGLPEIHLNAAKDAAKSAGHENAWMITLEAPSYIPAMTYLDDAAKREMLYKARQEIATTSERDNTSIAEETIKLRKEKASILNYQNYADFVTDTRMAQSAQKALDFEQSLVDKTLAAFQKETEELLEYKKKLCADDSAKLLPWDLGYYAEKFKKEKYDFDKELLRPYFEFEKVLDGAFQFADKIFGLKFEEVKDIPVWHEDVKTYKILDSKNNTTSYCYVDLFPRPGQKRSGAWQMCMIPKIIGKPKQENYVGLFTGNFTKPTSSTPALLSFDETTTLFHEFGHLIHHLFIKAETDFLRTVPWDFIELPSQLFENWCWEKEMLDLFAKHYETGESIPQDLLDKMIKAKNFRSASFIMRQLGFGTVDLALHTEYEKEDDSNIGDFARNIENKFSPAELPDYHSSVQNFSHVFSGGYAAGYYSYMWASVLEAEAFSRFSKEGLFNQSVGDDLVKHIFEPGWTRDPLEMFNTYMGHDVETPPNPEAFLIREGIL